MRCATKHASEAPAVKIDRLQMECAEGVLPRGAQNIYRPVNLARLNVANPGSVASYLSSCKYHEAVGGDNDIR